eukprot:TRINITY_DN4958_c0_g1_i1.p1 TRINITY_DN4958_c0_g1~~TRINITY_DN4958_c0_g1_i1.p1  ORF type:complete len:948 (-),score=153.90 TRINITY_DN4958_c0_g1_i1:130-2973(-)
MQTLQPCLAPLLLLIAFLNAGCSASVGSRGGSETTRIYDPVGVLENSLDASDFNRTRAMLSRFEAELGRDYLCQWAVTAGLAFVDQGSPEPLSQLAEQYAQAMGLTTGKNGVLLLLSAGSFPGIAFAGSLISTEPGASAELLGRGEWVAARDQAVELLRAARPGAAARIALQGLAAALGPGLEPGNSRAIFEQKKLLSWKSDFQSGELWENLCGDRRCLELVLDDVRQLSAGFEAYYHEAMTFPALNLLGPAKKRRVLILGGGDGGIATHVLKFKTVEEVINIDIDEKVTSASKKYFPNVAQGLSDSRCSMLHLDAFAWVAEQASEDNDHVKRFDLVIIDFTDEPIEGAWSDKFFGNVKSLLSDDGIVVQNVGTLSMKDTLHKVFSIHAGVFGSTFPVSTLIPDYLGPYVLVLSSALPDLQPLEAVDWAFWESQGIIPQYYDGPAQHEVFFASTSTDLCAFFGIPTGLNASGVPLGPVPLRLPLPELVDDDDRGKGQTVFKAGDNELGNVWVEQTGSALSLFHNHRGFEGVIEEYHRYRDEVMVLPALACLGNSARTVLVLGGGSGFLAGLVLRWPAVTRVVIVEVSEDLITASKSYFPESAAALEDKRTELIVANAFDWISETQDRFDLVIVNFFDQPWLPARTTTRVPKLRSFYKTLRDLVAPRGLLVQEAGTVAMPSAFAAVVARHQEHFAQTWPASFSTLQDFPKGKNEDFDGKWFRPPRLLLLSSPDDATFDPSNVDWHIWQKAAFQDLTYYHPGAHISLFALPAELQRGLGMRPLRLAGQARQGQPLESAAAESLVHSFAMEAHGCNPDLLNSLETSDALLRKLADIGGLSVLGAVDHKFEPQGVTSMLLVSESHVTMHTWPEHSYAAIDLVSCKAVVPAMRLQFKAETRRLLGCSAVTGQLSLRGQGLSEAALLSRKLPVSNTTDRVLLKPQRHTAKTEL